MPMDICHGRLHTFFLKLLFQTYANKTACPTKQQKPRYPAAAVSAEHVASPANADGADAHAENDKARWFVSTGAVFVFIDIV